MLDQKWKPTPVACLVGSNTLYFSGPMVEVCYDLIVVATLLRSPPCHGTPFPCPLHPVLANSCISLWNCYLARVHRLEMQPLPLDTVPRMWSLLSPWLRIREVRPLVPLASSLRNAALRRCSTLPLVSSFCTATFRRYTAIQIRASSWERAGEYMSISAPSFSH